MLIALLMEEQILKKLISILVLCVITAFGFCLTACEGEVKHEFGTGWVYDAYNHWHECKECGEKNTVTEHRFNNSICLECGYNKGHEHSLQPVTVEPSCLMEGAKSHYRCTDCGKLFYDEKGERGANAQDLIIPATGHKHGDEWLSDNNFHWQIATCSAHNGQVINKELHVMGAGNVCVDCGKAYGEGENDIHTTERLGFEAAEDGSGYLLSGIGTTTEKDIVVPDTFNNKPVVGVKEGAFVIDFTQNLGTDITSIILPYGVKTIGKSAFWHCEKLQYASIPGTLEAIPDGGFDYCYELQEITIPSSVKRIGQAAFAEALKLKKVTFETSTVEIDGKQTEVGVETLIFGAFNRCIALEEVVLPNTIKEIELWSFANCTNLKKVIIPDSLEKMENQVFANSNKIQTLSIPFIGLNREEAYHLGFLFDSALIDDKTGIERDWTESNRNSVPSTLTSVNVTDSTVIADYAFSGCGFIKNITIGSSLVNVGRNAFDGCDNLYYNMYEGGKYIGNEENPYAVLVGIDNKQFSTFNVNENTVAIGGEVFSGCESLKSISLPDSLIITGSGNFTGCYNLQYNEYEGGLYLGNENNKYLAFVKPVTTALTSISFHEDTKVIMGGAFKNCGLLTDVNIADGIVGIGVDAFANCISLAEISLPQNTKVIGSGAFLDCSRLRDFTSVAVEVVGNDIFENCASLEIASIPAFLTYSIPKNNLKMITITGGGNVIEGSFQNAALLEKVVLDEGVTGIEMNAFNSCKVLKEVIISDSVKSIDERAFEDCYDLENVSIGAGVESIHPYAFAYCMSLKSLVVSRNNKVFYSSGNCIIEGRPGVKGGVVVVGSYRSEIPNDGSITKLGAWSFYAKRGKDAILSGAHNPDPNAEILRSLFIPASVEEFEDGCLATLIECREIKFGGTQTQWRNIKKGTDWDNGLGGTDAQFVIIYDYDPDQVPDEQY